ncbi:hypothetical protein BTM25_21580 [Actinomadura rubteroloni]|uniref:Uncharacterized protein n=1 Tax=Actinomadura rubteroloni TaxID=1926885 RepID=A0A2P4URR2_9ACTN|nr:hypothetical protein [Actinomadura rubteroloni]POM27739.1 hypothetical protein BTM25_21580 [Actinomadura rubteroloni]
MDGIHESERQPVYHVGASGTNEPETSAESDAIVKALLDPELTPEEQAADAELAARLLGGERLRLFLLVRVIFPERDGENVHGPGESDDDADDADDAPNAQLAVVAYGVALPRGSATTLTLEGRAFGHWQSPESAARRLHAEMVWVA